MCLFFSKHITSFGLHRADFMFFAVIVIQSLLLKTHVETVSELKVIMVFHLLGFAMEVFKSHPAIGSRSYPDTGLLTVMGVPLYSGFMYSAVGSFIFQARDILKLKFKNFPKFSVIIPIAVLIYMNFMTHHFIVDLRWVLLFVSFAVSYRTFVGFFIQQKRVWMHVGLGLGMVGICLWIAENIATYGGAWVYPNQIQGRALVDTQKIISRLLLFIVSFVLVAYTKRKELYSS